MLSAPVFAATRETPVWDWRIIDNPLRKGVWRKSGREVSMIRRKAQ